MRGGLIGPAAALRGGSAENIYRWRCEGERAHIESRAPCGLKLLTRNLQAQRVKEADGLTNAGDVAARVGSLSVAVLICAGWTG